LRAGLLPEIGRGYVPSPVAVVPGAGDWETNRAPACGDHRGSRVTNSSVSPNSLHGWNLASVVRAMPRTDVAHACWGRISRSWTADVWVPGLRRNHDGMDLHVTW